MLAGRCGTRSAISPAKSMLFLLGALLQYRERIIFLGKAIDEETGNQLVATMLYLDSENKKDLNLYINCSGGDVSTTTASTNCCQLSILVADCCVL